MNHPRATFVIASMILAGVNLPVSWQSEAIAEKHFSQTGCGHCCPACNYVCQLEAAIVDEDKKCFEIETEVICIPRVVFPWQRTSVLPGCGGCTACVSVGCSACVHNGAKTRKIKLLKSKTYSCPRCEYTWTAEENRCGPQCHACAAGTPCDLAVPRLQSKSLSATTAGPAGNAAELEMIEVEYLDDQPARAPKTGQ